MTDEPSAPPASEEESKLVATLLAGDEAAFATLVERHHSALLRMASMYVSTRAVAEEVVQDTWVGVLKGLDGFEGRSSLRTWIYRILVNTAKTRGQRERRSVPFSSLGDEDLGSEPAVEADRFFGASERWPQHWSSVPASWEGIPEDRLLSGETLDRIRAAIEALPPGQRRVIEMRDVDGWTPEEVCNALGISETNQRVLLHRARSKVRAVLEGYLERELAAG